MTSPVAAVLSMLAVLSASGGAGRQAEDGHQENANLQVINATIDLELARATLYVVDDWPKEPLGRPLATVNFGETTGYLKVPVGTHVVVACAPSAQGRCASSTYNLEAGAYQTVVVIGGRLNVGGNPDEGEWNTGIDVANPTTAVELPTEARWRSQSGRRLSFLNAVVASPRLEACIGAAGKSRPVFTGRGPQDPDGSVGLYGAGRKTLFAEWGGEGELNDDDFGATRGAHADIPTGAVVFELRSYSEEEPCGGKLWGASTLVEPRTGMILAVAVGHGESATIRRALVTCSQPTPPRPSKCYTHPLR